MDIIPGKLIHHEPCLYRTRSLKVHPDGNLAAIAGHDGTFKIWSIVENRQVIEIKAHEVLHMLLVYG